MSLIFDNALGKVAYYGTLPGATDNLVVVPLLENTANTDEDLRPLTTLADALLLFPESTMGRLTPTSVTSVAGVVSLFTTNDGWLAPPIGLPVTRLLVCYVAASGDPDSAIVPLVSLDTNIAPDGVSDVLYTFDPFFTALDQGVT